MPAPAAGPPGTGWNGGNWGDETEDEAVVDEGPSPAALLLVVGGDDDDTVVVVTDAEDGCGGLMGRIEADIMLF